MQPGSLTQKLSCRQFVSMGCPGMGAAARNLILMQVLCGHSGMLGSQLKFDGRLLVEGGNLRAWITHGRTPDAGWR
jgi:hypothetical protein